MPSTCASAKRTGMPKALAASSVILCAASVPSMSKDGSASGIASAWAWVSASAKPRPSSRILLRMKLVVPLMMPATHSMRLAVRPSRSAFTMGMLTATAPS